jgi:hypothetical protein
MKRIFVRQGLLKTKKAKYFRESEDSAGVFFMCFTLNVSVAAYKS